ncbi:signal peptide peptidase SppA [Methanocella arvoryzae]|nr:signal peptide peptidase SppA [Methanocella arvoryzae]
MCKSLYSRDDQGVVLLKAMFILGILAIVTVLIAGVGLYLVFGSGIKGDLKEMLGLDHDNKVAVVYIEGKMIADKSNDPTDDGAAFSSEVVRAIRKATADDSIKAIVLRVNSPGGTPVAAEEIIAQINRTKAKKPVIVSMGDSATSAAYYVSASADKIFANPDTFTGSIGVIWVFKNKTRYYNEEGINFYIAKSGNYKDVGADWRGLSENEKSYIQSIINESYERFVTAVATGRNLPENQIRAIADGRVMTGTSAKSMGLVDEIGGLYDAIEYAAKLGGIKGEPVIVHMNEPGSKGT